MKIILIAILLIVSSKVAISQQPQDTSNHNFQKSKAYIEGVNEILQDSINYNYHSLNQTNASILIIEGLEDTIEIYKAFKNAASLANLLDRYPEHLFFTDLAACKDTYETTWLGPGPILGEHRWISNNDVHIRTESSSDRYFQVKSYQGGHRELNTETGKKQFVWTDYFDVTIVQIKGSYLSINLPNRLAQCKKYSDSILNTGWKYKTVDPRLKDMAYDRNLTRSVNKYLKEKRDTVNWSELPSLILNDDELNKLVMNTYAFAVEYSYSTSPFESMIEPIISKEELFELKQISKSHEQITDACNYGEEFILADKAWALALNAYDVDRFDVFIKVFASLLTGALPFNFKSASIDPIEMLGSLGLEVDRFLVGLLLSTDSNTSRYSLNEIAALVASSKFSCELFDKIQGYSNEIGLDRFNKATLLRTLSKIVFHTKDEVLRNKLKGKL